MRITNRYMTNNIIQGIQQNLSNLSRSQEQLSTSRKLLRPSDEPNVMGIYMGIKNTLSYNEQYDRNIQDGLSYLEMNDAAMGTLGALLARAGEYAVQAANDTYNAEDRDAVAEQIDKMIDQVVDLANSTVGGKYIYAGMKNSRPPFERDGDKIIYKGDFNGVYREVMAGTEYRIDAPGVTTGMNIEAVNNEAKNSDEPVVKQRPFDRSLYGSLKIAVDTVNGEVTLNGTLENASGQHSVNETIALSGTALEINNPAHILDGLQLDFNGSVNGAEFNFLFDSSLGVFGNADITSGPDEYTVYDPANASTKDYADKGIFDVLFELRDRLRNNDSSGLQNSIDEIQNRTDLLLQHRVQIGARTQHFESLQTQLLDQETKLTANLNNIEGADMARLSIEAAQQQLAYNASLAIGAKIMSTSLLDFLR